MPLVSAAMAGASGGELAARVTKAGGFGFIGTGYEDVSKLRNELALARTILKTPSPSPLKIGVGFLVWTLEKNPQAMELVTAALDERVKAVWLFAGNDLYRWVEFVRKYDAERGILADEERTLILVQVNSVEEALKAVEMKVDVISVQGIEAGGHGHSQALPLLTLLPTILRALPAPSPSFPPSTPTPVILAAGGLTHGSHLVSLLALGAHGIVIGTRFLLTPSSLYTPAQKSALAAAPSSASVRSFAFDAVRGTTGWPEGVDGRGLKNGIIKDEEEGVDIEERKRRYGESVKSGDVERMVTWAGASIGLVDRVEEVEDIVNEIHDEAVRSLQATAKLLEQ
ncbi:hypothetical protein BOTBODRAFT_42895 [Botryobasidium botryosum FD-172 SS1]|uniref:Uncharacterized protein n=1 Tax=Botryobasidium botryosum (strain FD-172 SS1) TaxID=930990 RepID=A0A067MNN5_BOTB1|nr:hypothetical protein BOTBODRAFT_42895 [Botryobasidium botryosum FD-172 SS1]